MRVGGSRTIFASNLIIQSAPSTNCKRDFHCSRQLSDENNENNGLISNYPDATVKQIEYFMGLNSHACTACQKTFHIDRNKEKEGYIHDSAYDTVRERCNQLKKEQDAVKLLHNLHINLSSAKGNETLFSMGVDEVTRKNVQAFGKYLEMEIRGEKLAVYHETGKKIAETYKHLGTIYHYHKYQCLCYNCHRLSSMYLL